MDEKKYKMRRLKQNFTDKITVKNQSLTHNWITAL